MKDEYDEEGERTCVRVAFFFCGEGLEIDPITRNGKVKVHGEKEFTWGISKSEEVIIDQEQEGLFKERQVLIAFDPEVKKWFVKEVSNWSSSGMLLDTFACTREKNVSKR
ncbi:TcaA 3rd/4th domain-containing protein [Numidum massiliense]|uniref:TcaA 3rd/4th domain-containing protein n=1 Tax=Numidum massiliense TaxID=1522315 RepID=UPI0006D59DD7|nr:hypothetical protein [Numidum massiliense]